jgi:hypothetical protein
MAIRYRQEVLNVILAQLLAKRNVISAPENIMKGGSTQARQMPDVLVNYNGLRLMIEGEVESDVAQEKALVSARRRVENGIAFMSIAIVYPAALREVEFNDLSNALETAPLQIAVVTEADNGSFSEGDLNYLENTLRLAYEQLVREDVVTEAAAILDAAAERFAEAILSRDMLISKMTDALGSSLPQRRSGDYKRADFSRTALRRQTPD